MIKLTTEFQIDLQNTFDITELPELCGMEEVRRKEVQELVETFVSKVTCIFLGKRLRGQTRSIKEVKDTVFTLIQENGLKPEDFRVNVQDSPDEPLIWRGIIDAVNVAVDASSANDRFWD